MLRIRVLFLNIPPDGLNIRLFYLRFRHRLMYGLKENLVKEL